MKKNKFITCINCIDGRVQEKTIAYLKERFGAKYVDLITEPGPDAVLSSCTNRLIIGSIKRKVEISVCKHGSEVVAIAGHYDCAANAVNKNQHLKQIRNSVKTIDNWGFNLLVVGLWVNRNFEPEVICSSV